MTVPLTAARNLPRQACRSHCRGAAAWKLGSQLHSTSERHFTANARTVLPIVNGDSVVKNGVAQSKNIVTCEHAGNDLPSGVEWGASDVKRGLNQLHWAYDPGSREFALELAAKLNAPAVMSRYSRLFVDLNRPVASPTLARSLCDGQPVDLNRGLTAEERHGRILNYYLPYHHTLEKVACDVGATRAVSVHTFTPNYEGSVRDFQVGVLFSTNNGALAEALVDALKGEGIDSRINEPWSGKDGFTYSADCFAMNAVEPGTRSGILFEFRNDCCLDSSWRQKVQDVILPLLRE